MSVKNWVFIVTLIFVVLALWTANFCTEISGIFGDKFGVVNSLFSGLAFAGIIFSILLQSNELRLQREELGLQRQELQATRKVFKDQTQLFQAQLDDGKFFNLLKNHRDMVTSLDDIGVKKSNQGKYRFMLHELALVNVTTLTGNQVMLIIAESWKEYLEDYIFAVKNKVVLSEKGLNLTSVDLVKTSDAALSLYETTTHILKFIAERFETPEERSWYNSTVVNTMTLSEKFIFSILDCYTGQSYWLSVLGLEKDISPFIELHAKLIPIVNFESISADEGTTGYQITSNLQYKDAKLFRISRELNRGSFTEWELSFYQTVEDEHITIELSQAIQDAIPDISTSFLNQNLLVLRLRYVEGDLTYSVLQYLNINIYSRGDEKFVRIERNSPISKDDFQKLPKSWTS